MCRAPGVSGVSDTHWQAARLRDGAGAAGGPVEERLAPTHSERKIEDTPVVKHTEKSGNLSKAVQMNHKSVFLQLHSTYSS